MIDFSRNMACWFYLCEWGCSAIDFEGEQEAREAFVAHKCPAIS